MIFIFGGIFLVFIVVWFFFTGAVIFHLRKYTLPGWSAPKLVLPIFFTLSAILFLFAVYFFFHISFGVIGGL